MSILQTLEKTIFALGKIHNSGVSEKEIKILGINVRVLEAQLQEAGAKKYTESLLYDCYFDTACSMLKKNGKSLRIRKTPTGNVLCYKVKKKAKTHKHSQERETPIANDSYEKVVQRLATLGIHPTRSKKKLRIGYALHDVKFDIDIYPSVPPLLEIEGPNGKSIQKRTKKLSLHNHDVLIGGTKKLFSLYKVPVSVHTPLSKS